MEEKVKEMRKVIRTSGKILAWVIGSFFALLLVSIFLIRLPAIQNFITAKAILLISSKTHTRVAIKSLYVGFPKSLIIEGLFAEDLNHDTLISLGKLELDVNMFGLFSNKIEVNSLTVSDLNANIIRTLPDSVFNFSFLIEAFSANKIEEKPKQQNDAAWTLDIEDVELTNIHANYLDAVSGLDMKYDIGQFKLSLEEINLDHLNFEGDELFVSNTRIKISLSKASEESIDTAVMLLPGVALKKLEIENTEFDFIDRVSGLKLYVHAGSLLLKPEQIDLNKQLIKVHSVNVKETSATIAIRKSEELPSSKTNVLPTRGWQIEADLFSLQTVNLTFDVDNTPKQPYGMDYNHLGLLNINLELMHAFYNTDTISVLVNQLSLTEKSGLNLKKLSAFIEYGAHQVSIKKLLLVTAHSDLNTSLSASFPSVKSLSNEIGELELATNFTNCKIGVYDILIFAPMFRNQEPFKGNKGNYIVLNGHINGKVKDLHAENIIISTGKKTVIKLSANIHGLPDIKNTFYDVNLNTLLIDKSDAAKWTNLTALPVNIPGTTLMYGNFKGRISDFKSDMSVKTSEGNLNLVASIHQTREDTFYNILLTTTTLNLGYILRQKDMLGPMSMKTTLVGRNFTPENLHASLITEIKVFEIKGYKYTNIAFTADATRGKFAAALLVSDTNIHLNMQATANRLEREENIKMDLELDGAYLQLLKLSPHDVRMRGKMNVRLTGKELADFKGRITMFDVMVVQQEKKYRLDSFLVIGINDTKQTTYKDRNSLVNVDYAGNLKFNRLTENLSNHFKYFINAKQDTGVIAKKDTSLLDLKLAVYIKSDPFWKETLLPKLKQFKGADMQGDFSNERQELNLDLNIPVLEYNGSSLFELKADIHSNMNALNYQVSMASSKSGPVNLAHTTFTGKLQRNKFGFALQIVQRDSGSRFFIAGNLFQEEQKYILHLDDNLVFNNHKWTLSREHNIVFENNGIYVKEFVLSDHTQSIRISSKGPDEKSPLLVRFKEFELGSLSQIVEKDTAIVRGLLNGTLEIRNLQKYVAFVSDLHLTRLAYMTVPIGDVHLEADNLTASTYTINLELSGKDNKANIRGTYISSKNQQLHFIADIRKISMQTIESFSKGQLRKSSGYLTGKIDISGTGTNPILNGEILFKDVSTNVAYVNNRFTLTDEKLKFDQEGIYFNSFTIRDTMGQTAKLDGAVHTSDFSKMKFDLRVTTNKFTVLNTNIRDNALYFGRIILSSKIRVKGNDLLPQIDMDATLLSGSKITVIIPSGQLNTNRGEGVITFMDHDSGFNLLRRLDSMQVVSGLKGIELNANIEVNRNSTFKVIVDRVSGDSLVVKGDGILSFSLDQSGKQSLTGNYVLSDGSYNATFQKVVKRDFKIKPGSTITWNGSPMDANIDIKAIYRTKASPADLLANELAGSATSERSAYRKLLTFDVGMMMTGPLMRPEISFDISMIDKEKNAFGGVVYSKISSLNGDPAELNKQVFALIVMNKFIASGAAVNTGEESAVNSVVRNSVNQALGDQLNQLSGKYVKGVELNFDLQTNEQYTDASVQQNTAVKVGLKKEFLNNRMSVQVGSNVNVEDNGATNTNASNLTGDVIVEYKLTEDGHFRFKAFRENQYEGIIDGMLYKTGVGLIYSKEYDTLGELFRKTKTKSLNEETN
ncbi:MAG: translocation/assembly module TamB domain-containing protein [Bacteroidia bacterium]